MTKRTMLRVGSMWIWPLGALLLIACASQTGSGSADPCETPAAVSSPAASSSTPTGTGTGTAGGASTPSASSGSAPSATSTPCPDPKASASGVPDSKTILVESGIPIREFRGGGGGNNIVRVKNETDGRFRARGSIEVDRIGRDRVAPVNLAEAESSCTDCQTIALAVQIALYEKDARQITPHNEAIAINFKCTRCVTVARAMQFLIPVEDLDDVPRSVDRMAKELDRELRYFERVSNINELNLTEAEARLNGILAQFQELLQYLHDDRSQADDDDDDDDDGDDRQRTPTPTRTATSTPSP